jgi:hypothetical protein
MTCGGFLACTTAEIEVTAANAMIAIVIPRIRSQRRSRRNPAMSHRERPADPSCKTTPRLRENQSRPSPPWQLPASEHLQRSYSWRPPHPALDESLVSCCLFQDFFTGQEKRFRRNRRLFHGRPRLGCGHLGALGEIRTPDPRNRNPMLYPAELRVRAAFYRVERVRKRGIWPNFLQAAALKFRPVEGPGADPAQMPPGSSMPASIRSRRNFRTSSMLVFCRS